MPLIAEKQLPLEYTNVLQMLTMNASGLYYTKYVVNKLGVLEPKKPGVVKERLLPPVAGGYFGPNICPVGILSDDTAVWMSGIEAGVVARFQPGDESVVVYRSSDINDLRFLSYRLAIDKARNIWCKGSAGPEGKISPAVCRLEVKNKLARYWKLPIEFISPFGLWVDKDQNLWFTIINSNVGMSGVSFARLNPDNGHLTAWTMGTGYQPSFAGIVGEPGGPRVWVTEDGMSTNSSRVYRYDLSNDTCVQFSHPDMLRPRSIVLDESTNAWFTSLDGRINRITKDAKGKPAAFTKTEMQIKPSRKPLIVEEYKVVSSDVSPSAVSNTDVADEFGSEIHRWKVPSQGNAVPDSIVFFKGKILFVENTDCQIGLMDAQ